MNPSGRSRQALGYALISMSLEVGGVKWRGQDSAAIKPILIALASLARSRPEEGGALLLGPKQR